MVFKTDENAGAPLTDLLCITLDEDGNAAGFVSLIDFYKKKNQQLPTDFEIDKDGNIYVSMGDTIYVLNPEGTLLYEAMCEDMVMFLCRDDAGKIYTVYSAQGDDLMSMAEVDSSAKALGARHNIPLNEALLAICTGSEGKLLMATSSIVAEYNIEEKTVTELFQWLDLDIMTDYYGLFQSLADGRILWLGQAMQQDNMTQSSLMLIRPREEGDAVQEDKEILTLGGLALLMDDVVNEAIANFNRNDPDYRIEIIEYGMSSVNVGREQLNADIMSGNAPDILVLPTRFSLGLYSAKGVLEDLYPFMNHDESTNPADFQENILNAFETDGKLYAMPVSFLVHTVMGRSSVIGEQNTWNLDEMIDIVDRIGDDSKVFYASKSEVLNFCLMANNELVVNWNDSEKAFDRETFIKVLEFANRFTDDDQFAYSENDMVSGLTEGDVQLFETAPMGVSDHQLYKFLFGEPVNYVGYPSENGSGSLANSVSLIAINKQCSNKEAAWKFISSMLTEECQERPSMILGFPIRRSSLLKRLEQAKEPTAYLPYSMGGLMIDLKEAQDEDVQAVLDLIESVDKIRDQDNQINLIISEEAQTYFSGVKSAEEAADVAENRVQLYIDEMR